jgi:hypothetical protein
MGRGGDEVLLGFCVVDDVVRASKAPRKKGEKEKIPLKF